MNKLNEIILNEFASIIQLSKLNSPIKPYSIIDDNHEYLFFHTKDIEYDSIKLFSTHEKRFVRYIITPYTYGQRVFIRYCAELGLTYENIKELLSNNPNIK